MKIKKFKSKDPTKVAEMTVFDLGTKREEKYYLPYPYKKVIKEISGYDMVEAEFGTDHYKWTNNIERFYWKALKLDKVVKIYPEDVRKQEIYKDVATCDK